MLRKIGIVLFLCVLMLSARGQNQYSLNTSLKSFIDNREYFSPYQTDQTFLANRFNVGVDGYFQNQHRLSFGITLLQHFGSFNLEDDLDLRLNYNYNRPNFRFSIGSLPWKNSIVSMPAAFIYDSLNYYKNNLEGMVSNFYNQFTFQEFWMDWTQRADSSNQEQFTFGHSGGWYYKFLRLDHHALFTHTGFSLDKSPEEFIQDEFTGQVSIGLDLSRKLRFDSLRVRTGLLITKDRARPLDWRTRQGWITEFGFRYDWIGFNALLYKGEGLKNSLGDPFYQAKSYARNDLYLRLLNRQQIFLELKYSLHITEGIVDHQQAINLRINLSTPLRR